MSLLKDDLLGLKSKLENIEKEFETQMKDVEGKEDKFKKHIFSIIAFNHIAFRVKERYFNNSVI